ncbi:Rossmann-fold NAD(P)-binding domain-containing protein [Actinomadura macrotermitis]|nr:hypothetical protein [Actinomadura macrotermitis]
MTVAGNIHRTERAAVEALAGALAGSGRPLMVANALSGLVEGRSAVETDQSPEVRPGSDRGGIENLALDYVGQGCERAHPVRAVCARAR